MRIFRVKSFRKKVRLPERDYKVLLERFDERNAEDYFGTGFNIPVPCICKHYDNEGNMTSESACGNCPFARVSGELKCISILEAVLGEPFTAGILLRSSIRWPFSCDAEVRRLLKIIHNDLLSLHKV